MILNLYTVFDKAVGAYLPPFYARARGEALRSFSDACNASDSNFFKYPQDYTLCFLGTFDDASGVFVVGDPVRVISAQECRVSPPVLDVDLGTVAERTAQDGATFRPAR